MATWAAATMTLGALSGGTAPLDAPRAAARTPGTAVILPSRLARSFSPAERNALREIASRYKSISDGFASGDVRPVLDARTSDFAVVTPDGQLRDAGYAAELARRFFTTSKPPYSVRVQIRCARFLDADHAILVIFQQVTRYQELAEALRRVDSNVTQREHWRRTPAGWRMEMIDGIHNPHRWVDGKAIDPSRPYNPGVLPFRQDLKGARSCEELLRVER